VCATSTPIPTPTSTFIAQAPTPTPAAPELPKAGTDWVTYFGIAIGLVTIIGALMLAL
jgi:hypothetical protein